MPNNIILGVPAFWHYSNNFGDALTPYLIKKISGYEALFTQQGDIHTLMVTGSILGSNVKNSTIWGCGYAWSHEDVHQPMAIAAVRGYMTRNRLLAKEIDCPDVVGDPALLLPRFYLPKTQKKYRLGIIPHVVDYAQAAAQYFEEDDVLVINLADPIEKVIWDITTCEKTVSSSLHGLIASHAYGVDSLWVKFSDKIIGDGFKYMDYFSSVGIDAYKVVELRQKVKPAEIEALIPRHELKIDLDKLFESCPLHFIKPNITYRQWE